MGAARPLLPARDSHAGTYPRGLLLAFAAMNRRLSRRLDGRILRAGTSLFFLMMSAGAATGFGFVAQALLARLLGPSDYGVVAAALTMSNVVAPVASFGIGLLWLQRYAEEGWKAQRWVLPSLKLAAATTVVAMIFYIAWAELSYETLDHRIAALIILLMVPASSIVQLVESKYQLEGRYRLVSIWQMSKHLAILAVAGFCTLTAEPLIMVAVWLGIAALVFFGWACVPIWQLGRDRLRLVGHGPRPAAPPLLERVGLWRVVVFSWPFAAMGFIYFLFFQNAVLLLTLIDSTEAAGVYAVAVTVASGVYLVPRIIFRKLLIAPLNRWYYQDRHKLASAFKYILLGMFPLGAVIAAAVAFLAPWFIPLAFGGQFGEAIIVLGIVCLCFPFRFVGTGCATLLIAPRHVATRFRWDVVIVLLNAAVNVWAIENFSAYGAAWTTVGAEVTQCFVYIWLCRRLVLSGIKAGHKPGTT